MRKVMMTALAVVLAAPGATQLVPAPVEEVELEPALVDDPAASDEDEADLFALPFGDEEPDVVEDPDVEEDADVDEAADVDDDTDVEEGPDVDEEPMVGMVDDQDLDDLPAMEETLDAMEDAAEDAGPDLLVDEDPFEDDTIIDALIEDEGEADVDAVVEDTGDQEEDAGTPVPIEEVRAVRECPTRQFEVVADYETETGPRQTRVTLCARSNNVADYLTMLRSARQRVALADDLTVASRARVIDQLEAEILAVEAEEVEEAPEVDFQVDDEVVGGR
ncbi:hypothetical protein [Sphingomicrobium nitratireducens]|uniref:hypothetical protein n=1 Tax=Sphingomicrobium nitratireducens TaxID=2964666 RepID=UPI002240BD4D|nr:hypothetical protein [Sphingomicrobium nitratireducens]